jgi:CO/xanthine dehydrogenase Mo-binding subunit
MSKFALGQSVTRIEDAALVQGAGCYTDDFELAGAAHACVLRSPHAHANILNIDTAVARNAPGVLAVLTGADAAADGLGDIPCLVPVTNIDGTPRADTPRPVLAMKRVRHVGDPVALVVAETLAQAKDAAELIAIDYEPLPAGTTSRTTCASTSVPDRTRLPSMRQSRARRMSRGSSSSTTVSSPIRSSRARHWRISIARAGAPRSTRRARDRTSFTAR